MAWTRFMDMRSGGSSKEDFEYLYVEAPADEAKRIFFNRFGHNPERVTCTCCGDDYSIRSADTLEKITAYERGCAWEDGAWRERPDTRYIYRTYVPLSDFLASGELNEFGRAKHFVVIRADEIKPEERLGDVPRQGFVWVE